MLSRFLSVGGLTLLSRLGGFLLQVLQAAFLGAGPVADAFVVALKLPNHLRALFAEGAFNAAFVPTYAGLLALKQEQAAERFAGEIASLMLVIQLVLLGAALAAMPWIVTVLAPGFRGEDVRFGLAVELARITFPYLLFVAFVVLMSGIANSRGRFAAAAGAPVLMNGVMIAAVLLATPGLPTAAHALAWGLFAAGAAEMLLLAWDVRRAKAPLRLRLPRLSPEARTFFARLGPAALGAGVTQISLFMDTLLASLLPPGGVSSLFYADRLNQLPIGVVGVALGTILLPGLTQALKRGEDDAARRSLREALVFGAALALPCAAAFLAFAEPLMAALFQRGAFTPEDAAASAFALRMYGVGAPAFIAVRIVLSGFYAKGDTATPVKVALVSLGSGIALKVLLIGPLAEGGLALGTALSSWINAGLLAAILARRGLLRLGGADASALLRIAAAAALMGGALWAARLALGPVLAGGRELERLPLVAGLVAAAALLYALALLAFGLLKVAPFDRITQRLRRRGPGEARSPH